MKDYLSQGLAKKTVCSLFILALAGCDSDDAKDLFEGKTKVFTVTGAQVSDKLGNLEPGYYDISAITNVNQGNTLPAGLPVAPKSTLDNLGIKVSEETCGKIEITDKVCFEIGNANSCIPEQIDMLGLKVYTIDLAQIQTAASHGFYPKLATLVGGSHVDISYTNVSCSSLPAIN